MHQAASCDRHLTLAPRMTRCRVSAEQQPGCGIEGVGGHASSSSMRRANVLAVAKEKGVWHAWDGVHARQQLNLTFAAGERHHERGTVGTGRCAGDAPGQACALVLAVRRGLGGIAAARCAAEATAKR